uniref:DUF834 domain-containing protein n=1 Tax=Oryza rufipogon TaxID=4529 RepID=A0A0E0NF94_ORYRU
MAQLGGALLGLASVMPLASATHACAAQPTVRGRRQWRSATMRGWRDSRRGAHASSSGGASSESGRWASNLGLAAGPSDGAVAVGALNGVREDDGYGTLFESSGVCLELLKKRGVMSWALGRES